MIRRLRDARSPIGFRREIPGQEEEHLRDRGIRVRPQRLGESIEREEAYFGGAATLGGRSSQVQHERLRDAGERK